MAENELERVTVRLEPKLKEEVEVQATREHVFLQDMWNKIVREWLAGRGVVMPANFPYPDREREWHDKLHQILSEGTNKDATGIQVNIDWAVSDIQRRAEKSSDPRQRKKVS